jgi:hypothetical protein
MQDDQGAEKSRKGTPRRQGAKASGGGKQQATKKVRVQFHLGVRTMERLGVHCSLAHSNNSAVVEKVLSKWLRDNGKGREWLNFPDEEASEGPATDPT